MPINNNSQGIGQIINNSSNPFYPINPDVPEATVVVAEITYDDEDAAYIQFEDNSVFTDYIINNRYEKDRHIYMAGVTSPGGLTQTNGQKLTTATVQLSTPTLLWICDWTCERQGTLPIMPATLMSDQNWVLLDESLETREVRVAPDGISPIYRLSGTYYFGHKNPNANLIRNVVFGYPPWLRPGFQRTMPDSQVRRGIINTN